MAPSLSLSGDDGGDEDNDEDDGDEVDYDMSIMSVPVETWEENWLFRRKRSTGTLSITSEVNWRF